MDLQSLPFVTGAPCAASMAPSSSTFSTVITHGRFPYLTPSTAHSFPSGILPSNLISFSGLPEQPSGGNFSGPSSGGNNIGIYSVESQEIPSSVRTVEESDDWLTTMANLDDIITTDITSNCHQMAESAPVPSYSNSKSWQHDENTVHQSVSVPSKGSFGAAPAPASPPAPALEPEERHQTPSREEELLASRGRSRSRFLAQSQSHKKWLHLGGSGSSTTVAQAEPSQTGSKPQQVHPKSAKARMRWTIEMNDRFVDAVNLLGGSESAKPKAILDIMNVQGLSRDQVKSHLQKYKEAQKRPPSEVPGTSAETTMCTEVQKKIREYALQLQFKFQKELHDMVETTLLESRRRLLCENHVMSTHEFEQRQTDRLASSSRHSSGMVSCSSGCCVRGSGRVIGEPSNTAAPDDEGGLANQQATEAGSPSNGAGA